MDAAIAEAKDLEGDSEVREGMMAKAQVCAESHPGVDLRANIKSISHRCHPILVAFVWELAKETINFPLGCLQGGCKMEISFETFSDRNGPPQEASGARGLWGGVSKLIPPRRCRDPGPGGIHLQFAMFCGDLAFK